MWRILVDLPRWDVPLASKTHMVGEKAAPTWWRGGRGILSKRWRLPKTKDPPPGLALAPAIAGTSCHTQARASLTPSP